MMQIMYLKKSLFFDIEAWNILPYSVQALKDKASGVVAHSASEAGVWKPCIRGQTQAKGQVTSYPDSLLCFGANLRVLMCKCGDHTMETTEVAGIGLTSDEHIVMTSAQDRWKGHHNIALIDRPTWRRANPYQWRRSFKPITSHLQYEEIRLFFSSKTY